MQLINFTKTLNNLYSWNTHLIAQKPNINNHNVRLYTQIASMKKKSIISI